MGVKDIKKMLMQFAKNEEIPEKVDEKPIPPNKEDDIREVENSIDKVSGKDVDNKTLSVVYNKLGTYEYDKGNLGKALNFFGKSLELEPQNRAAWYNKEKSDLKLRRRLENEIERAKGHVKNVETYLYEDYERESEAAKKDQIMKDVNLLEKLEKRFASFQESIELSSSGSSRKKFSSKEKTKKRKKLFKFDLDLVGRITNLTSAANIFEEEYIQGTDMNIITEYRKINKHLTELRNAYTHRETFIREG